mmetsp:Transcript_8956/g.16123  ORF Transcript_8956/g.16123 Transcript_8956/m.16123 type:complete len:182 (-) Transcript_8956:73-618(-)
MALFRVAGSRMGRRILSERGLPVASTVIPVPAIASKFAQAQLRSCAAGPTPAAVSFTAVDVPVMDSPATAATEHSSNVPVRMRGGAIQKLKDMDAVLRLMVNSGGCSGYSYEFSLIDRPLDSDIVVEQDGALLVVDELSLTFLEDCEVDYVEEMIRSSFQVVKNKLADSKCGCGSSFSIGF